jgi:hypothetical protein
MNRKVMLILFAVVASATMAVAQTKFEDASLVGRWTMRNTGGTLVEDFSGNNFYGFLQGASFFKTDATMSDSVQIIDGSGEVSMPHSSELEPARGTVETFVKVDQLQYGDIFFKVSLKTVRTDRRDGTGGAVYGARVLADGSVQGYIMNDDPKQREWTFVESPRPVIVPGTWHHIALQWDGKMVRLFVDGVVVAKQPYKEIPGVGLSYFGETPFTLAPGASFVGQIGETRIYNRPLSDAEVKIHSTLPATQ